METKINIAAILKDKPQGTKLYDWLHNIDIELDTISTTDTETVVWCTNETNNNTTCHRGYSEFGTERGYPDGLQILFPSKEMRDWEKFAWKEGDVLVSNDSDIHIIFKGFSKNDYTTFEGKHWISVSKKRYLSCLSMRNVQDYHIEDNKDAAQTYINTIEERLGGKLNRESLEVEKTHPKFKDGDIVALVVRKCTHIAIFQSRQGAYIGFHAVLCQNDELLLEEPFREDVGDIELRLATDSEKQQLFEALAKESKQWDAGKKMIIDLKQKVELKPFDKVLVRHQKTEEWRANIFSHTDKTDEYLDYVCVNGRWEFCIPYEGNESLLGTTKDVEDRYD